MYLYNKYIMSSNLRLLLLMTILTNKLKTIYLRNNNLQLFRNTETLVKHNFVFKMDKFLVCVGIVGNYPSSEVIKVETLFGKLLKRMKMILRNIWRKDWQPSSQQASFLMWLDKISKFYFLNIYVENKNNIII